MSDTADEMNMGDGVAIKVEQIEPWSETLQDKELRDVQEAYEQFGSANVVEMPIKDCNHEVMSDITSLCSIQKIRDEHSVVLWPFPESTQVFECNACGEIRVTLK